MQNDGLTTRFARLAPLLMTGAIVSVGIACNNESAPQSPPVSACAVEMAGDTVSYSINGAVPGGAISERLTYGPGLDFTRTLNFTFDDSTSISVRLSFVAGASSIDSTLGSHVLHLTSVDGAHWDGTIDTKALAPFDAPAGRTDTSLLQFADGQAITTLDTPTAVASIMQLLVGNADKTEGSCRPTSASPDPSSVPATPTGAGGGGAGPTSCLKGCSSEALNCITSGVAACSTTLTLPWPQNVIAYGRCALGVGIDCEIAEDNCEATCRPPVTGSVCCASSTYPRGGSCVCTPPVLCYVKLDGTCYCAEAKQNLGDSPASSCHPPAGGSCCLDKPSGFCDCASALLCPSQQASVSLCDVAGTTPGCRSTDHPVHRCR
jgi:hypothetical protein